MIGFMEKMGSAVCHQMAERSLFFDGMQMPLCARCTGIYIGAFFAFWFFFWKKRLQSGGVFSVMQAILTGIAILPVGIDSVGSYLGFWESSQWMRIMTGCLVGAVVPGFLLMAGNFDPKKEAEILLYKDTGELLLLMAASVVFGFCLLAGVPIGVIGAVCSIAGEILVWGGLLWLILKNILGDKKIPCWTISLILSFVGLFAVGGLIS